MDNDHDDFCLPNNFIGVPKGKKGPFSISSSSGNTFGGGPAFQLNVPKVKK